MLARALFDSRFRPSLELGDDPPYTYIMYFRNRFVLYGMGFLFFACSLGYADQFKEYSDAMGQNQKGAQQTAFELFEYFDDIARMIDIAREDADRIPKAKLEFDRNISLCAKAQKALHGYYSQAKLKLKSAKEAKPPLAAVDLKTLEDKLKTIRILYHEGRRFSCKNNRDFQASILQGELIQGISLKLSSFVNKLKSSGSLTKPSVNTARDKPGFPDASPTQSSSQSEKTQSGSAKTGH
jgi:hypothetical protein